MQVQTSNTGPTVAAGTFRPMPIPGEAMFRRTRYFEVDSDRAGARYAVWITTPPEYDNDSGRSFPTIYMPDGNGMVLLSASVSSMNAGELIDPLEPTIQVCVGYTGDDVPRSLAVRARDLLPPHEYLLPGTAEGLRNMPPGQLISQADAALYADYLENPAGDRFLAFLAEELHPFVRENYRVDADDLGLFGHSYGGLFATFAALQPSTIFRNFGAGSPGLLAEHSVIFRMYRDALASGGLSPRRLHMTLATRELTDPSLYQGMVGAGTVEFMRMAGSSAIEGLTFTSRLFEDETHMSVLMPTFYSFLRAFYRRRA